MAQTDYTYSLNNDFGGSINLSKLDTEIREDPSILIGLVGISTVEGVSDTDVIVTFKAVLDSNEQTALDQAVANHDSSPNVVEPMEVKLAGVNVTPTGQLDAAVTKAALPKVTIGTPDFCKPTSWWQKAEYHQGVPFVLDPEDTRLQRKWIRQAPFTNPLGTNCVIDATHSMIWKENSLFSIEGGIPVGYAPVVVVDGVVLQEKTLENPDGDYVFDYENCAIVMEKNVSTSAVVSANFWMPTTSAFTIKPKPGKVLTILTFELQFSQYLAIRDTTRVSVYGLFAGLNAEQQAEYIQIAQIKGWPVPGPMDKVLYRLTEFKGMRDFIIESNLSSPVVPPSLHPDAGERDLKYPWIPLLFDYQGAVPLYSSADMELVVDLANDRWFLGEMATGTAYAVEQPDPNWQG